MTVVRQFQLYIAVVVVGASYFCSGQTATCVDKWTSLSGKLATSNRELEVYGTDLTQRQINPILGTTVTIMKKALLIRGRTYAIARPDCKELSQQDFTVWTKLLPKEIGADSSVLMFSLETPTRRRRIPWNTVYYADQNHIAFSRDGVVVRAERIK